MKISPDAFIHHPELQSKIKQPSQSFFRDFDAVEIFNSIPESRWVVDLLYDDEYRDKSRRKILNQLGEKPLWVFAYGSLMWDPALVFSQVRHARIPNYARCFILKDVWGGRGTREKPGLMAALDKGAGCEGLAYCISSENIEAETKILWNREMVGPGYVPTIVSAMVNGDALDVITFVADHDTDSMQAGISREEQIEFLATGSGLMGTSHEYLKNIVDQFSALGIVDEDCSSLLTEVEAHIRKT